MRHMSTLPSRDDFPSYRGGHTRQWGGYVWEFCPGHPLQNSWGWVAQHRLVGEMILGRPLIASKDESVAECVHHIDEDRTNNHPTNLEILTMRDHRRHHAQKAAEKQRAHLTAEMIREALVGRTIREAAHSLGVTHMTVRKRFPDVIAHRKRRSPCNPDDPALIALVRKYAMHPKYGMLEASVFLGIHERTVFLIAEKHQIPWVRKEKAGYKHRNPRRKATHGQSNADETWTAPVQRPTGSARRRLVEERIRRGELVALG